MLKILLVGNCQTDSLAGLIEALNPDVAAESVRLRVLDSPRSQAGEIDLGRLGNDCADLPALVPESDIILLQSTRTVVRSFEKAFPTALSKVRLFPNMAFPVFHPDMAFVGNYLRSPTGRLHSSIACYGWTHGLGPDETISLFREEVFEALGFFSYREPSVKFLVDAGAAASLPMDALIAKWTAQGCWMHTANHPKLFVLADLARALLQREGLACRQDVGRNIADRMAQHSTWGCYPAIAQRLGVEGEYRFSRGAQHSPRGQREKVLGLEEFVRASFEMYSTYRKDELACDRLASSRYVALSRFLKRPSAGRASAENAAAAGGAATVQSPYRGLPDCRFWRRAVERKPSWEVDPVVRARFPVGRGDRVATAGSCFAQHISRTLVAHGFNYHVAETGEGLPQPEAQRRNFGVFSARYGNIYTARQLLQLFDRAHAEFTPADGHWMRADGRLVDPFRPQVEPDGFASIDELEASRAEHFSAVRAMFANLDVFVFTLGLTEAWRSRADGAIYPLAPGVAAGEFDDARHEFINFGVTDVAADMQMFVDRLLTVNPRARVVLTVSPVPLIATFEDRHVLVSTTYSKSVLRVAAEEICRSNRNCDYFPAYEIITGNYARGAYFEDDLRSVNQAGVDHVMRLFLAHFSSMNPGDELFDEVLSQNENLARVVCDEDAVDA